MRVILGEQILLFLIWTVQEVNAWNKHNYPSLISPLCSQYYEPIYERFLCDPDNLLETEDEKWANEKLNLINSATTCDCIVQEDCRNDTTGYSVALAVLRKIDVEKSKVIEMNRLVSFSKKLLDRWKLDHCDDDALITICEECQQVYLIHGERTRRKIPEKVRKKMIQESNNLMKFTNYTYLLKYLLNNYEIFLTNQNRTPSVSMLELPFPDLSTGVITVMVLTTLLTVAWALCLTYLVLQYIRRRKFRLSERGKTKPRTEPAETVDATSSCISLSLGATSAQRILSPTSGTNGAVPRLSRGTLGVELDGEGQSPLWLHSTGHPRHSSVFSETFTEPRDIVSGSMMNFVPAANAMTRRFLCRQKTSRDEDDVRMSFLNRAKSFSESPSETRLHSGQTDSDNSNCRIRLISDDLVVHHQHNGSMPNMPLLEEKL